MKAGFYDDLGPARLVLRVGEQPTPQAGPGEVLVRLHSSGINPSDVKSRGGAFGRARFLGLTVPHSDGAGDIVAVGAGVPASRVGERVWLWNGQYGRAFGTAAEFIAIESAKAVKLPDAVGYDEGACLGIPAMTACQAVRLVDLAPGHVVLVSGGAGAVGHYAIQFAKARGATVIATISNAAKAAHAKAAGADVTINYRTEDVPARLRELTGGAGLDAIVEMDITANAKLITSLRFGGRISVYGVTDQDVSIPGRWMLQNAIILRFLYVYEQPPEMRAAVIREISAMLASGKLINAVGGRFPLNEIAAAHEAVEQGALGNVVLTID
jgi:NADPH2:quinone reductase